MAKETILVVEDSPTERGLIVGALQGKGYRVVTAGDGEEAIEKVASEKPDLVVLDVVLPRKNGFQVCRQLKTAPESKDLKIVLVTSKSQETDRSWGMRQGADEYLTKPFKADDLTAAVARHI